MYNSQFQGERNSNADIVKRLDMEIHDFYHAGPPDDDADLIQLLEDSRNFLLYLYKTLNIEPGDIVVPDED